jgi:hypothetical protein
MVGKVGCRLDILAKPCAKNGGYYENLENRLKSNIYCQV